LESRVAGAILHGVRIAKPILLVTTPIGVIGGLYEAYHLAGGLVFLMAALIGLIGFAIGTVVLTIRREKAAAEAQQRAPR
jgi:hypothetical protein